MPWHLIWYSLPYSHLHPWPISIPLLPLVSQLQRKDMESEHASGLADGFKPELYQLQLSSLTPWASVCSFEEWVWINVPSTVDLRNTDGVTEHLIQHLVHNSFQVAGCWQGVRQWSRRFWEFAGHVCCWYRNKWTGCHWVTQVSRALPLQAREAGGIDPGGKGSDSNDSKYIQADIPQTYCEFISRQLQ